MPKIMHNPDVLWRRETEVTDPVSDDETVAGILFSGGSMLSLNEFALEIWQICDGKTLEELVVSLMPEFDIDEETLRLDIREFLDSLSQKGFIRYE
ncbi:MAG: PqqD family peptide modification chaperone [Desulfuromonadaceae bacterium]|nr:PqqD family peptide modification chaperone [Desulfuromonadaceae bacterium]MDD2856164.1 PqqD family peptide modification chaperone [Desulfuromonadaceae bacterium]